MYLVDETHVQMGVPHVRHHVAVSHLYQLRLVHLPQQRRAGRPGDARVVGEPDGIVFVAVVVADEQLREKEGERLPDDQREDRSAAGDRGPRRRRSCGRDPPSRRCSPWENRNRPHHPMWSG